METGAEPVQGAGEHAIVAAMFRWGWFATAYGLLSVVSVVLSWTLCDRLPIQHPDPWLTLDPVLAHSYSVLLGLAFAGLTIVVTRVTVQRFSWARELHRVLQPFARAITGAGIACLATLSGLGEELFFRGLLAPSLGVTAQALVFGFLHQVPGASRWVWVAWATVVGFLLGIIFQLTGSIWGPVAAHILINWVNLTYLKTHDLSPPQRPLGGLLGQRS